jgi:transposase InsO family protein
LAVTLKWSSSRRSWRIRKKTHRMRQLTVWTTQQHLRAVLAEFADYYNRDRPHRSLGLWSPLPRGVRTRGRVVSRPVLGGLHHVYARVA